MSGGLRFGGDPGCFRLQQQSLVNPVDRDSVLFDTVCFVWISGNSLAEWKVVLLVTGK